MKHYPVQQGTDEWLRLRLGKPTASNFDKLITAKKWEPTKGETRRAYAIYLLTELIFDMPLSGVTTAAMQHGTDWEASARAAYEMLIGEETADAGFCTNDEMTYGASPDAFVGQTGLLEVKSPFKPEVHVEYLMNNDRLVEEYFVQVQSQLFVCEGRQWTDLISYHSSLPMVKVRCAPVPEFQDKVKLAVHSFCAEFSDLVRRAVDLGYLKQTPPTTDWITAGGVDMVRKGSKKKLEPAGDFDLSESDIRAIWENSQK